MFGYFFPMASTNTYQAFSSFGQWCRDPSTWPNQKARRVSELRTLFHSLQYFILQVICTDIPQMVPPKIATILPPFSIFITMLIQATSMSQLGEHSRLTLSFHFCPPKIYSSYSNQAITTQNGSCYSCALIPSMALHCCEKNNLNFLLKRLFDLAPDNLLDFIWGQSPQLAVFTSSKKSAPSLSFDCSSLCLKPYFICLTPAWGPHLLQGFREAL